MKEKLYTIPVNDAFHTDCECPVCQIYHMLEKNAIEFTMGPSYMEDDVRMETDQIGFCDRHVELLYQNQNRLGLALMLQTHMERIIRDVEALTGSDTPAEAKQNGGLGGLFRKKSAVPVIDASKETVSGYVQKLTHSCYICNRIQDMYERYLATIFYLYKNDAAFRETFQKSKGVCTMHYGQLRDMAVQELSADVASHFVKDLDQVYLTNMKRVRDDLEWFVDKFDYRNADKPWNNSKDALPRAAGKTIGPNRIEA